jgi:uncharacterized protein
LALAASRIWTDIDFDKDGKQVDWLHLPHSVTRSAYGTIAIPCAVIKNGKGPQVLLMAGNHGDEYEGQVTLARLIRELKPQDIQGRIIVVPAINLPAAMAGLRVSPIDEINLNRAFPGDPGGRPTEQIAYFIETELVTRCEYWFDLHSGGGSLDYVPFASIHLSNDKAVDAKAMSALTAFGSPISVVWSWFDEPKMATSCAHRNKVVYIGGEFGGTGSVNPDGVKLTYGGTVRTLRHIGALQSNRIKVDPPSEAIRFVEVASRDHYVYAPEPGLFEPNLKLGTMVGKGDLLGWVHFVDNPMRPPIEARIRGDGMLICKRHQGRVERGDCLAHLASDKRTATAVKGRKRAA